MDVKRFIFNPIEENCYVVNDDEGNCVVIDPGCSCKEECEELNDYIKKNGLMLKALLNTHLHFDHIWGDSIVAREYGVEIAAHADDLYLLDGDQLSKMGFPQLPIEYVQPTRLVGDGEVLEYGKMRLRVVHTPGHSPGGVCYYEKKEGIIFTGDTLFRMSIGRSDFPGGNSSKLLDSIYIKLFSLADDVVVYPGHGPETTIGEERRCNPAV